MFGDKAGGGAFMSKEYRSRCENWNIEFECCSPRMHSGNVAIERAIQSIKNLNTAKLGGVKVYQKLSNWALRVMRYAIHIGLKRHQLNYTTEENREPHHKHCKRR